MKDRPGNPVMQYRCAAASMLMLRAYTWRMRCDNGGLSLCRGCLTVRPAKDTQANGGCHNCCCQRHDIFSFSSRDCTGLTMQLSFHLMCAQLIHLEPWSLSELSDSDSEWEDEAHRRHRAYLRDELKREEKANILTSRRLPSSPRLAMITALLVEETSPPWDAEFEEGARSPVSTLCSLSPPSSAPDEAVVLAKTPS